jgi:hypothetical protein
MCYQPSKSKVTNVINGVISLGFIVYEALFFGYNLSDKQASDQMSWSIGLLTVSGLLIVMVLCWILYRFILFIR